MKYRWGWVLIGMGLFGGLQVFAFRDEKPAAATTFEIAVDSRLLPGAMTGRILVVLGPRSGFSEPRLSIGRLGKNAPPVLGWDGKNLGGGSRLVLPDTAMTFPREKFSDIPSGKYLAQAVFAFNRDLNYPNAPGNLYSEAREVEIDHQKGGKILLTLNKSIPPEKVPESSEMVHYLKIRSDCLSKFHGRDIYLRAGLILPRGFYEEKDRKYPLRVHIGGYGSRYTRVGGMMSKGSSFERLWMAKDTPRFLFLHLDGAGPLGDPYQVDSANRGPFGRAVTQELIPQVEKKFRGIGKPTSRVLDGASTGGWVSLALQVFYPDFFNGAWSHAPDSVDFRAFELIDIYRDQNVYVNRHGFERPAMRQLNGDVRYTVRHEVQLERVLGRNDQWTLSGRDWAAWNATFGPRGKDGLPVPLWDGKTGVLNKSVLKHWENYDLRLVLQRNWTTLGPKLKNKLHIWVGDADEYFLNNGVRLLEDFLKTADPPFEGRITFAATKGHSWTGISEKQMMLEMQKATVE